MQQILTERSTEARIKVGLNPNPSGFKDEKRIPSIKYVKNPLVSSKTELNEKIKAENVILLNGIAQRIMQIWPNNSYERIRAT